MIEPRDEEPLDDARGGLETAVQIDGAEQSLERIGQDGLAPESARFQLAGPQVQRVTDIEGGCYFGERLESLCQSMGGASQPSPKGRIERTIASASCLAGLPFATCSPGQG